jgi:hypothetical protein
MFNAEIASKAIASAKSVLDLQELLEVSMIFHRGRDQWSWKKESEEAPQFHTIENDFRRECNLRDVHFPDT